MRSNKKLLRPTDLPSIDRKQSSHYAKAVFSFCGALIFTIKFHSWSAVKLTRIMYDSRDDGYIKQFSVQVR